MSRSKSNSDGTNEETEHTRLLTTTKVDQSPTDEDVPAPKERAGPRLRGYVPVEVICFLYFFNTFLASTHTQFYVYSKLSQQYGGFNRSDPLPCGTNSTSTVDDVEMKVQEEASTVIMYLTFASTFSGVIPTILLGSLTDRYGRKVAFILAITGTAIKQGIYTSIFILDANINYLYIGNVIEGVCGYYGAMLVSLFSSVADITEPGKERAFRITSIEASLFVSTAVSVGVSGVWIENTGFMSPLYVMLGISVLNMVIVIFVMPETRRRSLIPFSLTDTLKTLTRSVVLYTRDTSDRRRWKLQVTVLAFFLSYSISIGLSNILTLYLLKSPFCWSMIHITVYVAVKLLVDWGCILLLTRCFGHMISDVNIALIASTSSLLCLLMIGLANNDVMVYIAGAVGIFTEALTPMLRSVMSRLVSSEDQGALFGSISVVEMLSGAVFGMAITAGYKASLSFFPGLVFVCLAGLMGCIALSLGLLSCALKKETPKRSVLYI